METRLERFQFSSGITVVMILSFAGLCLGLAFLGACATSPDPPWYRATDGAEMMLVPGGEFLMGSTDADTKAGDDEMPLHSVYLDAFWIDRTEVSNAHYVQFLNTMGEHTGACGGHDCVETKIEDKYSHILWQDGSYVVENGFEGHPVTQVSWYGAQAYCVWAGARLPTAEMPMTIQAGVLPRPRMAASVYRRVVRLN